MTDVKEMGLGNLVEEAIRISLISHETGHEVRMHPERNPRKDLLRLSKVYEELNRREKILREVYKFY